jgi:tetratricopeptide (TPR) repeat protein
VWRPSRLRRLSAFVRVVLKKAGSFWLLILILPLVLYIWREVPRDVLIIDPFAVPKAFSEAGLTPEVMANRIGDRLLQIELATQTRLKKDNPTSLPDEASAPDIQIPGTKLSLRTFVDVTRSVFGIYPKHIGGDIVLPLGVSANAESQPNRNQATITVYVTQGRNRNASVSMTADADNIGNLVEQAAELALGQTNPYVLAAFWEQHHQDRQALEIVEKIVRDSSTDPRHKGAALNLWGNLLRAQKKYAKAIVKYEEATKANSKLALPYNNWGIVLREEKKYPEAIAAYQKAIQLDPDFAFPYNGWGNVLKDEKRYDEAVLKYQKAIDLDPTFAYPYSNWGMLLEEQGKYEQAIAKYQKAVDIDPTFAFPYDNWGNLLDRQNKFEEAVLKFQKAIEVDPKDASAYNDWGNALRDQTRYDEAIVKYQKAIELDTTLADAHYNLGTVLRAKQRYSEAAIESDTVAKLSRPN